MPEDSLPLPEANQNKPEKCLVCEVQLPSCDCVRDIYIPHMDLKAREDYVGERFYVASDFAFDAARETMIFGRR